MYRGKAVDALDLRGWDRSPEGVVIRVRRCVCAGAVREACPHFGADVVLTGESDEYLSAARFSYVTPEWYVTDTGARFARDLGHHGKRHGTLFFAPHGHIVRDELARLEAWAASQTKEKAR